MIKGIIFDYGGTIDSRGEHWAWVIRDGWTAAGLDIDITTFRDAYVWAEREMARTRHVLPHHDFLDTLQIKMALEMAYLVRREKISPDDAETYAERIAQYCYGRALESVNLARPVIEALARKYPLVLVSNFYGNIEAVLADFGLSGYFQAVVESAVVGVRKPDPEIFRMGVRALGLEPGQVLVVGDSYRKDILPARAAGCRTLWLKGRGWTTDEDAVQDPDIIKSLQEIEGLVN